ncbi:MAG: protein kinase family protein [Actinomycetes bacterium]
MQPETVVQGTSLDNRYRLEQQVGAVEGCTMWQALDTVLSRRAAVLLMDGHSPRADAVLEAARAASIIGDPRLVRILDASRTGGVVYVVTEWVDGVSLADQLVGGPLDPGDAAYVVAEVAGAVATAHQAGVPHLRLHPHNVLRSRTGEIRVTGLGVAAALAGVVSYDPAREDTRALGALLYAALTARWPDGAAYGLAAAPTEDGRPCTPRQVLAGVPGRLDAIAERALEDTPRRGVAPLSHPAEVALALADIPRTSNATMALPMLPPEALTPDRSATDTPVGAPVGPWEDGAGTWPAAPAEPYESRRPRRQAPPPRRRGGLLALTGTAALVLVAAAAAIWQFGLLTPDEDPRSSASPSPGAKAPAHGAPLNVASITDFDPEGEDGGEYPEDAPLAVDGDPATSWQTSSYYNRPDLGGLKSGVGLLLDLGSAKRVGSVDVTLAGSGTDLEVRGATTRGESQDDYRVLDRASNAGDKVTLEPNKPERTRYVLLWLTELPPDAGNYRGRVAEVTVRS